ncbi:UBX domain protein [Dictyocaulus viviparus]|uniref:UBX domain protein n=1 Tax=Dictyocaulus viviparus TaxID=29172 RepID=A0A0D8Y0Z1_DICVI|nr:UBX domain protein [Dictyocaulus viviparus]
MRSDLNEFGETSVDEEDVELMGILDGRKYRRQRSLELDSDDTTAVDMEFSRPSSSVVTSHRPRNGYTMHKDVVLSDDDIDAYPVHDSDDMYSSERHSMSCNNLPLIPTECGSVTEALQNFVVVFESRFSGIGCHIPPFFTGSLPEAIKEAFETPGGISERRPLALYIHHDRSIAANIFPSKVLCNDTVSNLLRCQYILWPWDVTHRENEMKLLQWLELVGMPDIRRSIEAVVYDKEKFPLLVIITKDHGQYNINDICSGMDSADIVMEKLMAGIEIYTSIRNTERTEEAARLERERIRQEQAHEYEMSLAADKARMQAKVRELKEQREEEERRMRVAEELEIKRQLLASQLPDEPAETDRNAIMVKFRLPGSEQVVRRFRSTEKLSVLMQFLGAKGFSAKDYRFFNSDFPKKDVTTLDDTKTFSELNWPVREQIFIEER